jgi:hypothetical protein
MSRVRMTLLPVVVILFLASLVAAVVDPNACLTIKGSNAMPDFEGYSVLKSLVDNANTVAELDTFVHVHEDQQPEYVLGFR